MFKLKITSGKAVFVEESSKDVSMSGDLHYRIPQVVITPADEDVNAYVSNITRSGFTINTSAQMTGDIYYRAISVR